MKKFCFLFTFNATKLYKAPVQNVYEQNVA